MRTSIAMTRLGYLLVTLLALFALFALPAFAQSNRQAAGATHIAAELIAETATPASGSTVTLAIAMTPDAGWHGYWSNPGEAGFEPRFDWRLPQGARAGTPEFPVPRPLLVQGLMNYVYEGPHALLVPVTLPAGLAAGTRMPVALRLDYLACTDAICVPQRAQLTTVLVVGDGRVDASVAGRFDRWRAALPAPLGSEARFVRQGGKLRLAIPYPSAATLGQAHFFPARRGMIDDAGAQSFGREDDLLIAELPAGSEGGAVGGVLSIGDGRGLTLTAVPGPVPPLPSTNAAWSAALIAMGGAILGGLILNIMPCVFPILSLKALSLAKAGGGAAQERAARRDALGYTAGAVAVCVALGAAILALRSGGASIGWAFQLQDPRVIVVLLALVVAIALNLAGLFELPTLGGGLASGNSIATGALAAFVATPCTGPFMGAALGAALVLPPVAAIAVFAGLGFGLALPFLLLGFVPALRRRLPRPGAWMATMRRVLSVPMFATALGLAWLLGRQAGVDVATWGLAVALVLALVLWWTGLRQSGGRSALAAGAVAGAAVVAIGVATLPAAASPSSPAVASTGALAAEPFSEARLAALRASGTPVFAYFTADWCLTCKVNERVAIERAEVAASFKAAGVKVLVGDWTRSDPAIGRFLAAQGRSGVPLYLFYPARGEAQVLPQVLTPATLTALATAR